MNLIEVINNIINLFLENWIGQTIGLVAFTVSVYNFLFCKNKKFIFFTMIASIVWGIHFFTIGLLSAALINIVDIFKNGLALKYEKSKKITIIFIILYLLIGFLTFDGYLSLIPTLTALIGTYLVFYVRGVWLNLGFMGVIVLWSIYNFLGHSIGGLSTDVTLFVVGIIGIIRMIKENKKNKIKKMNNELKKDLEII